MWRKTLIISTVGLVGFLVGMTVGRFTAEPPALQVSERLDSQAAPIVPSDTAMTSSYQSEISGLAQNNQPSVHSRQGLAEQKGIKTEEATAKTSNQDLRPEASVALTSDQKRVYNDLYQRVETAPYGGITMSDLQSQMVDLPREYQAKLLEQVVNLVNSGQLDPQKFVEGVH